MPISSPPKTLAADVKARLESLTYYDEEDRHEWPITCNPVIDAILEDFIAQEISLATQSAIAAERERIVKKVQEFQDGRNENPAIKDRNPNATYGYYHAMWEVLEFLSPPKE